MTASVLDFSNRSALFAELEDRVFDVLVIGGGITGAGIARDAALRGLDVALVEARDFASGTSSRSTKLIHGGLRYLAQGDLGLVREAASERAILCRIAPHLAQPTEVVLPAPSWFTILKLKAGLMVFERLGKVERAQRHEIWSRGTLQENEPVLRADGLAGAAVYTEYVTDDARLTLANIRSARAVGATIASYAPVRRILMEGGCATGAVIRSSLPGENLGATIRARIIVNAAGPWVDAVRHLEDGAAADRLQLTRGVHLVMSRDRFPLGRTVLMPAPDGRSVFAVPRGGHVYLGTTDTFYAAPDYWPGVERADVDYLLATAAENFDMPALRDEDVVAAWSGLRPLIAEPGKSPSEISRRDEIWTGPGGILSIAGGKLTAYRRMAERAVDDVEDRLGRTRTPCQTGETFLPGGEASPDALRGDPAFSALQPDAVARLIRLYGAEAPSVAAEGADVAAEVHRAVHVEGALTLEDYWTRRSARALFDDEGGIASLEEAATLMGAHYDWSDTRRESEIETCRDGCRESLAWKETAPGTV